MEKEVEVKAGLLVMAYRNIFEGPSFTEEVLKYLIKEPTK